MYNHSSDPPRTRAADSWIEIPSRPSNSSLSSAAAEDAVSQSQSQNQRRRRPHIRHSHAPLILENEPSRNARSHGGNSSQEEYDESESESDRVVTSSNEALAHNSASDGHTEEDDDEEDYDDYDDQDEIATAIGGYTNPQCFTPQPNAFSHPPSASRTRSSAPGSYFPPVHPTPTSQRHSYPGNQHRDQRPLQIPSNAVSPSHQAHHDAALRASLTTLLSCAAAARGLPKKQESSQSNTAQAPSGRVETTTLRMVPESVALGGQAADDFHNTRHRSSLPSASSPSSSQRDSSSSPPDSREPGVLFQQYNQHSQQAHIQDKSKRKAASGNNAGRSSSKDRRAVKKARRLVSSTGTANIDEVSPTAMTWVVSAGILVLVSALSFSYGYSVGRESGRLEASTVGSVKDLGENATGCAREVGSGMGKGLKRLRWGTAASVRA